LSKLDVLLQAGCDGQYVESPGMRFDEDPEKHKALKVDPEQRAGLDVPMVKGLLSLLSKISISLAS
jgi:hypothetical protein